MLLQEGRIEQTMLKTKMTMPKRDLIKMEDSKAHQEIIQATREKNKETKGEKAFTIKIKLKLQ